MRHRLISRASVAVALVGASIAVTAGPAFAVDASPTQVLDNLFETAQIIALVAGVIIPFIVAKLTTARASDNVKTVLAFVATGLTALGTYLLDASGAHTWQGALSVFVIASVIAATSRKVYTEQFVQRAQVSGGVIGPKSNV